MNTKIKGDFQICISVPLKFEQQELMFDSTHHIIVQESFGEKILSSLFCSETVES